MAPFVLVFIGGGIGSLLRYATGLWAARMFGGDWPWGTFLVNLIGCCAMGLLFRLLPAPAEGPATARLLLMTGLLGGFTTFSAFALDSAQLWMRGAITPLLLYVLGSMVFALAGVALGLMLGKAIAA